MYSKNIKNKELHKKYSKIAIEEDSCEISKASVEIMLDRFCNGKEIDFPFLDN